MTGEGGELARAGADATMLGLLTALAEPALWMQGALFLMAVARVGEVGLNWYQARREVRRRRLLPPGRRVDGSPYVEHEGEPWQTR